MTPPSAMAMPAAVACTAPQAPSARPLQSPRSTSIATVSVPTANSPPPKPISSVPSAEQQRRIERRRRRSPPRRRRCRPARRRRRAGTDPRRGRARRAASAKASERADGLERRERRRRGDRQVQDLAAIGLEQDVLHANAAVPSPTATRKRCRRPSRVERGPALAANVDLAIARSAVRAGLRASCFHSATRFSTIVSSAAPWTTWIRRDRREVAAAARRRRARSTTMPTSSMT